MGKSKERQRIEHVIYTAHGAIEAAVNRACRYDDKRSDGHNRLAYKLQGLWRQLNEATLRQERAHRGPGFKRHHAKPVSVECAAYYFAAMAVAREVPEVRSWWTACDIRDDWRLGYALGEAFAELGLWPDVVRVIGSLSPLADIDYARDLV
jgi:hypothetical protein